jgi:two-component system CheB/CheR fusion protein
VKNTLGVVKAIARLTASTTKDQNAFNEAFSDRIMALAISHEELLTANWTGADFGSLIWSHLAPFVGENSTRLEVNGPAVVVPPEKVTDLGMVMHELGTNAVKYGAWSNNTGIVKVNWHVFNKGPGRVLTINWTEQGGPPATVSTHKGFGTKMINVAVEVIDRRFEPTGLVFEFALALPPPAGEQPLPMAASA